MRNKKGFINPVIILAVFLLAVLGYFLLLSFNIGKGCGGFTVRPNSCLYGLSCMRSGVLINGEVVNVPDAGGSCQWPWTKIDSEELQPSTEEGNEMSGWKIYENNKNHFLFKYPPEWQVRSYGGSGILVEEADSFLLEGEGFSVRVIVTSSSDQSVQTLPTAPIATEIKSNADSSISFNIYDNKVPGRENPNLDKFYQILSTFEFTDSFQDTSSEGEFCGGIAAIRCPDGYTCKLDGTYPDAGGKCYKN